MSMKKRYQVPAVRSIQLGFSRHILTVSGGTGVYTDDPQKPEDALSRYNNDFWNDNIFEEEDDE